MEGDVDDPIAAIQQANEKAATVYVGNLEFGASKVRGPSDTPRVLRWSPALHLQSGRLIIITAC